MQTIIILMLVRRHALAKSKARRATADGLQRRDLCEQGERTASHDALLVLYWPQAVSITFIAFSRAALPNTS